MLVTAPTAFPDGKRLDELAMSKSFTLDLDPWARCLKQPRSWASLNKVTTAPRDSCVTCGAKAIQGARCSMEDYFCIHKNLMRSIAKEEKLDEKLGSRKDLAFFGVFDGHGGSDVAQHCAEKLHKHFACALAESSGSDIASCTLVDSSKESTLEVAIECALNSPTCGTEIQKPLGSEMSIDHTICGALRDAFRKTDQELKGSQTGDFVGATAVVAVLDSNHVYLANCGDSRAVISRAGVACPVTQDHKPDREDEAERVQNAGGKIVFANGSYRVMGMLAMSRAIGDHFLRPFVIADPECTVVERSPDDEVLVLATDGLWDVFNNQDATALAIRCMAKATAKGMTGSSACKVAASVLTKAAMDRGSLLASAHLDLGSLVTSALQKSPGLPRFGSAPPMRRTKCSAAHHTGSQTLCSCIPLPVQHSMVKSTTPLSDSLDLHRPVVLCVASHSMVLPAPGLPTSPNTRPRKFIRLSSDSCEQDTSCLRTCSEVSRGTVHLLV